MSAVRDAEKRAFNQKNDPSHAYYGVSLSDWVALETEIGEHTQKTGKSEAPIAISPSGKGLLWSEDAKG